MKKLTYLLLIVLCLMCTSCNQIVPSFKENQIIEDSGSEEPIPSQPTYDILPDLEYNEPADSLLGVDAGDLSGLKAAVDRVGYNYACQTKVYFNEIAVERVIYNYKKSHLRVAFSLE